MNKSILIKYLKGEASQEELGMILDWVEKSDANKKYFADMKFLWDLSGEMNRGDVKSLYCERKKTGVKVPYMVAAAVVAALLVTNLIYLVSWKNDKESGLFDPVPRTEDMTVYTHKGVVSRIVLPDSTIVWMNADTRISYPPVFGEHDRQVCVSGEAYFEVKKDPSRPMTVVTNKGIEVEVLGTSFLIRSYTEDGESQVVLFEGSVDYSYDYNEDGERKTIHMYPGQSVLLYDGNPDPTVSVNEDNDRYIAWMKGNLVFENTPMKDVLNVLERWYGVDFVVKDEKIYKYTLTSTFYSEPLISVISLMELCLPVKFEMIGNFVTIY